MLFKTCYKTQSDIDIDVIMNCTNRPDIYLSVLFFIVQECDKGSYGIGCNETCGHCRDFNQCSKVNGSCLTGCDAGYAGDFSKARK